MSNEDSSLVVLHDMTHVHGIDHFGPIMNVASPTATATAPMISIVIAIVSLMNIPRSNTILRYDYHTFFLSWTGKNCVMLIHGLNFYFYVLK
jgi:hypothetical protein